MVSLSSADFGALVMFATFMASFQSPFSAYLAELKGSRSYLSFELLSFFFLVSAALLSVVEDPFALVLAILGTGFAILTYLVVFYEEQLVSKYSDA